jgi:outer membrane receptor protein involved in Fe transport
MTTWDGQLVETNIDNADLRWELFLKSKAQFISASVFFKNFNNPIELVRIPEQQTNAEYQARNVGTGRVYGFEFELRKNFDFIAEALENLVFSSNVTLVYSEIQMTDLEYNARKIYEKEGQNIARTRDMAGQSPYVVNCGLSYDNEKLGFSTGLFYNVKGPTLIIVGTGLIPDIYSEPFHSLNFSFTKKIGKEQRSSISFKVSNILNDRLESHFVSYGTEKQVFNSINPGVSFSLGVNVKL